MSASEGKTAAVPDHDGNAAKIEAHILAGETLRTSSVTVHLRNLLRIARPIWWAAIVAKSEANRVAKLKISARAKMMARTTCLRGHALTFETSKVVAVTHHGTGGVWSNRICLLCKREDQKHSTYSAEQVTAAIQGAKAGLTISQLTSYRHSTRVIRHAQLTTAMRDDPKLASALQPLFARNRATSFKVQMQRRSPRGIFAPSSDVVLREVEAAVPRDLLRQTRMEVVSDMVLAVLEGLLDLRDLKSRCREFIRRNDKMYYDRFYDAKAPESLDAPTLFEGQTPRIEKLSRELWDQMVSEGRA